VVDYGLKFLGMESRSRVRRFDVDRLLRSRSSASKRCSTDGSGQRYTYHFNKCSATGSTLWIWILCDMLKDALGIASGEGKYH